MLCGKLGCSYSCVLLAFKRLSDKVEILQAELFPFFVIGILKRVFESDRFVGILNSIYFQLFFATSCFDRHLFLLLIFDISKSFHHADESQFGLLVYLRQEIFVIIVIARAVVSFGSRVLNSLN